VEVQSARHFCFKQSVFPDLPHGTGQERSTRVPVQPDRRSVPD
jgi:hypothetical protein